MNNRSKSIVPLNIEITDIITPKSCSCFIAELIKYVVYNKEQIPYPFENLKMFVLRRRERQKIKEQANEQSCEASNRISLVMEKYYKKFEDAFETLNNTFKCIEQKLLESTTCSIKEIVLLFGATPVSPKDVYRIEIPTLSFGHSESQHIWRKQITNLFREIIISEEVNTNIHRKVGLTNMFIMIKAEKSDALEIEGLLPKDNYKLSERAQQVRVSFRSSTKKQCACPASDCYEVPQLIMCHENMYSETNYIDSVSSVGETEDQFMWFQVAGSLKGFRDTKSEGKSVIDLWHEHSFIS